MSYKWAVIGAGPAGIAAVGKLLDFAVTPAEIVWIDPQFKVGDFGTIWRHVPSNTRVNLFLKFLYAAAAFHFEHCPHDFPITHLPPDSTCELSFMADALQWVTTELKKQVQVIQDFAEKIFWQDGSWHITLRHADINVENVILAQGAEPKKFSSTHEIIKIQDAMHPEKLKSLVSQDDVIAVYGSSHSAILAIRFLIENKLVKEVVNLYRSPLRYAVYLPDEILFDDSGLKGTTADWARKNIDGELPKNLHRIHVDATAKDQHFSRCNKVIFALGFERRKLPLIENVDLDNYLRQSGMIAPGLFGVGIAFPEAHPRSQDVRELRVGLWKFMTYLERVMPDWIARAAKTIS